MFPQYHRAVMFEGFQEALNEASIMPTDVSLSDYQSLAGAYIEGGGPRGHGPPHDQKGRGQSIRWPPPWEEMLKKNNNTLKTLLPSVKLKIVKRAFNLLDICCTKKLYCNQL